MDLDFEIYTGKKFSSLCKDIVKNSVDRKELIKEKINKLSPLINTVGDAMAIMPLITALIETEVKNDEHLIKLASVIQKIASRGEEDAGLLITDEEKRQLLEYTSTNELLNASDSEKIEAILNNN